MVLVAALTVLSALCQAVAVGALIHQRRGATEAKRLLDQKIVIDGGNVWGVVENPTDHHLESHLSRLAMNQRPGKVAITAAVVGCVLALAAGVLSFVV